MENPMHWHIEKKSYRIKAIGMLLSCLILQAIPFCIGMNILPLFMPYVTDSYHISRFAFSVIFTLGSLTGAIAAPMVSKLYLKVNVKILFSAGILITGLSFVGFSFARHLPLLYAMAIFVQLGCCIFSSIGVPFVIHHWFPVEDAGKALGFAFAGGALGNIILQPLTMYLLPHKGISFVFLSYGIAAMVVGIPIALLLIRLPKAQAPDGTKTEDIVHPVQETGPSYAQTKKMPLYWIFGIGFILITISCSALGKQYAEYFRDGLKLSARMIGTIGSCFGVSCLIGMLVGSMLFDKIGAFKTMLLAGILSTLSVIALLVAKRMDWTTFVFALSYGFTIFSFSTGPAFLAGDVFGQKDYNQKLGSVKMFTYIGFGLGSLIFGFMETKFTFTLAWYVTLASIILGYILLLSTIYKIKKQDPITFTALDEEKDDQMDDTEQ